MRGVLPFDSHEVDSILKNTLKGDVPLDDDHWNRVSPEGKFKDFYTKFCFSIKYFSLTKNY